MKEAFLYEKLEEGKVRCILCAHRCVIKEGKRGICGVRENRNGVLQSLVYGKLVSMNIDPIEKKPLFHFLPGTGSFSISTVGCNFRCRHCQNFEIAQYPKRHDEIPGENVTAQNVVDAAERSGSRSIAYTYTEPTIFMEFAWDCARLAQERGIGNVFVSNGYTSSEAVRKMAPFLQANNIDLKGDDEFYKKICGARLQPVLDTIRLMKELNVWVEVTTLIIPGLNDSEKTLRDIVSFILSVDAAIPWHVTRFYPTHELLDRPRTPVETLRKARDLGLDMGLKFVYEGNVPGEGGENTYCPECKELLIERSGYHPGKNVLKAGRCPRCSATIEGIWR